jgi:hypothetical protein
MTDIEIEFDATPFFVMAYENQVSHFAIVNEVYYDEYGNLREREIEEADLGEKITPQNLTALLLQHFTNDSFLDTVRTTKPKLTFYKVA